MKEWRTISSQLVFHRRRVRILEDIVELPNGEQTDYLVLQGGEAVAVLPLTADGAVVLTRQYRYPVREFLLEMPGGGSMRGESLEESARRELREETGFLAGTMTYLGNFYPSPARSGIRVHVYVADDLQPGPSAHESHEFIEIEEIEWDRLVDMIVRNDIKDLTLSWAVLTLHARRQSERRASL